jgi:hypothetical protein
MKMNCSIEKECSLDLLSLALCAMCAVLNVSSYNRGIESCQRIHIMLNAKLLMVAIRITARACHHQDFSRDELTWNCRVCNQKISMHRNRVAVR